MFFEYLALLTGHNHRLQSINVPSSVILICIAQRVTDCITHHHRKPHDEWTTAPVVGDLTLGLDLCDIMRSEDLHRVINGDGPLMGP